ncbi:hypothetical protein B0H13DRAFT_1867058 [Mycena leptocephala]|nr:hypothetical protein B0H13DRAFT_1867058 [Mycena leptocephala]
MRPLKNNQETTPLQQQNHTLARADSAAAVPVHAGRRATTDIPWLEEEIGLGDEHAGLGLLQRSGGGGPAQWATGPPCRALLNGAAFVKGSTDHVTNMEHQVLSSGDVKAMEKQFLEMESSVISPASIKVSMKGNVVVNPLLISVRKYYIALIARANLLWTWNANLGVQVEPGTGSTERDMAPAGHLTKDHPPPQ